MSGSQAWGLRQADTQSLVAAFVGHAGRITLASQPHTSDIGTRLKDPPKGAAGSSDSFFTTVQRFEQFRFVPLPQLGSPDNAIDLQAGVATAEGVVGCLECLLCCLYHASQPS